MISCLSIKGRRRDLKKLQSLQDKKKSQKDAGKCNGDMERIRDEIADWEVQLQELEQKSQRIYLAEAELHEEIRNLQAGETRNSCASQSNGGCFDPTVVEQLFTLGAAQTWQQIQQRI